MEVLTTSTKDIEKAANIVRKGGIVAFPTDTVYGLGCDPCNPRALRRILSVKGKSIRTKPFPVLVASTKSANRIAVMDDRAKAIASHFWPGPITLVLKPKVRFPYTLTMGRKTLAVRCPNSRAALELIRKCGGLLTGTSANLAGKSPCTSARMIRRCLRDRVDAIVDGGRSPRSIASTVVRMNSRSATILRKGPVKDADLKRALSTLSLTHNRRHRKQAWRGKSFFRDQEL